MSIDWAKASKFSVPEDSAGYLLWQITHLWQRRVTAALAKLEITHLQFVLLAGIGWLSKSNLLLTQVQLSEFCQVDVMLISQVVRKLEDKNLIQRMSHPYDTRAKVLTITASGKRTLEEALVIVDKLDEEFFRPCDCKKLKSELEKLLE